MKIEDYWQSPPCGESAICEPSAARVANGLYANASDRLLLTEVVIKGGKAVRTNDDAEHPSEHIERLKHIVMFHFSCYGV